MRQFLLLLIVALLPLSLSAQEVNDSRFNYTSQNDTIMTEDGPMVVQKVTKKKYIRPTEFTDNWYITAAIGPHMYFGENEWKMNAADQVTFAFDLNGGRWFTPYLAVDFNLNFHKFRGIWCPTWSNANFATHEWYGNANKTGSEGDYYWQKGSYVNGYFRLLLDLSCMDGRERSTKQTHFIPFIGLGYASGTGTYSDANSPTLNVGLIYDVRFSNNISLNVTGRGALLFDKFDGEVTSEHGFDGMIGLSFGLVYRFGKTKKITAIPVKAQAPAPAPVVVAAAPAVDSTRIERERLEKTREEIIGMLFPYYANFTLNDTALVNREKVNLAVVAKFMNDNPKMKFIVSGYADMQTGSIERNKWLSENRAKRIVQVLVNEFMVDPKQLILEAYGGVANMFYNENQLSRCVIITIKE